MHKNIQKGEVVEVYLIVDSREEYVATGKVEESLDTGQDFIYGRHLLYPIDAIDYSEDCSFCDVKTDKEKYRIRRPKMISK